MSSTPPPPYNAAGPSVNADGMSKTGAIQTQIDDTVKLMRDNLHLVDERGIGLDELNHNSEQLVESAQGFRRGANRARKEMWWKDMRLRMFLLGGIVVILLLIIIPLVVKYT
ncbi:synaptobrevin-domain-containing protein [Myxozyma melibiosi]|uniref:Synaptobrevin-domain-containing protein n=1 Tax=Myxozyma melibiosi TaxID=54550 RepID=A0ABR1EZN6_9ASCO